MMTRDVPNTLVTETQRVMEKAGPWDRFTKAVMALDDMIHELGFSEEYDAYRKSVRGGIGTETLQLAGAPPERIYRLRPHREGLSQEDANELLFGHCGFKAEWANSGAALRTISAEYADELREVLDVFRQQSQCSKYHKGKIAHIKEETVRQALERLPTEMEALLATNADRISEDAQAKATQQVAEYRAALVDVLSYVDLVKTELGDAGQEKPLLGR